MSTEPRKTMSLRLSVDEMAMLDRMAKRHGDKTKAIVAGLKALDGKNDLTQSEVIAWIERNTRGKK